MEPATRFEKLNKPEGMPVLPLKRVQVQVAAGSSALVEYDQHGNDGCGQVKWVPEAVARR
eukprot:351106-Chlamydomonas_euryale.AAC.3